MRQLVAALAACVALAGCGGDDEPSATRTSYEVGGYQLWGQCRPGDSPTVVYLHGLGSNASVFVPTVERVAESHPEVQQCAFDRVNAGESEKGPTERPLAESVEELHGFLDEAEVEGPVVLVGASYGGLVAIAYAGAYPDDVKALIMADAPLPFESKLFDAQTAQRVSKSMAANAEHVDILEAYATAGEATLPDVPFVYVDATWQDLATQFGVKGYRPALIAYLDSLPQGQLILTKTDHLGVVNSPKLAEAVVAQRG